MKKGISMLVIILMLLISTNIVMATDDALDIEKVAIQSIKNSEAVQSINRQVTQAQENYADMTAGADSMRELLRYQNSYQIVTNIILQPLIFENMLNQAFNGQMVVTNAVRLSSYKAYIDLLKAKYAFTIQQDLMKGLDADYKKAQLQLTLGMISESQLRLSEIAYLQARYRFDSAQKGSNSASMSVNYMMGEEIWKQYSTLQDNNITPAAQLKPLKDYVNIALGARVEIINAQSTLELKKKQYEYEKAEVPTDYQFYIQQQEYALDSGQNDLELAIINVQLDITNLYKGLEASMKNLEAAKYLHDLAKLDYRTAEIKYENSQISLQEFNDAKVVKAQGDINYKNAELDAWLMQTTMDSACGIGYK